MLTLVNESSPPFLRGVVGVLGLPLSDFLVGVPGMTVKPAICFVRGLDSVDMAALYRLVVEDSKLDVEVSEITDAGLLGVKGILDDTALGLDDGVAGIGGMVGGRGTAAVCRRWGRFAAAPSSRGGRRENSRLRSLSFELREVEPSFPKHAMVHVTYHVLHSAFCPSGFSQFFPLDRCVV